MTQPQIPDLSELQTAYDTTQRVTVATPLLESARLARLSGAARVLVKPESLQRTGSFKFRGAYWRVQRLSPEEKARGVVAYSSGNFAQGLAAAAAMSDVPATIVMPVDAPPAKRRGAEAFGARIVESDHGERPREEVASALAKQLSEDEGLTLLHPFDDPAIVAGQAGTGLEALAQFKAMELPAPDKVLCCVGGGGLIGGLALALHYQAPAAQVIAVEPEGFDGMGESLRRGEVTRVATGSATICDALQATAPGAAPFAAAQKAGVRGLAVGDGAVRQAMAAAFEELKLVLEPSGAVALAALMTGLVDCADETVLVYATGGNVSLEDFVRLTGAGAL